MHPLSVQLAAADTLTRPRVGEVRFQPLMPEPVDRPTTGVGRVVLFSGVGVADRSVADVALACLLRLPCDGGKRLLVEAGREDDERPRGVKLPIQVAGGAVWRSEVGGRQWRRRHWVLFLHECRQGYTTTAVVLRRGSFAAAMPPADLADYAVAVTQRDERLAADRRRLQLSWRRGGVAQTGRFRLNAA